MEYENNSTGVNEEDRRLAKIISIIIGATWIGYLFVFILGIFFHDNALIALTVAGSTLLLVPMVQLRQQKLQISSLFLVVIELATLITIASVGQGIHDLAMLGIPIIILFAGIVLDKLYFRISIGLMLLAVLWLFFGEKFGWFVTKPFEGEMENWFYVVGLIIIMFIAALAVDLLSKNMRTNLERARNEIAERKLVEEALQRIVIRSQQLADQFQTVIQIGNKINSGLGFEKRMLMVYEQCQQLGDTDTFYVATYDDQTGMVSFPFFMKEGELRSVTGRDIRDNSGLTGHVIENRCTLYIPDQNDPPAGVSVIRTPGIPTQSYIGVPLILDDRVVGVVSLQSNLPNAYSPEQVRTLELVATQVAIAIQNSQLYEQVRQELAERKRAEEELRGSEIRFRSFIEQSPLAIGVFNLEGFCLYANLKFIEILGFRGIEDLIGLPAFDLFAPQYREESKERTRRRLQGLPVPPVYESIIIRTDGTQIPVQLAVAPIQLPSGVTSIAFLTDITEQKKAAQEIQELNTSLEKRVEERTRELKEAQEQLVRKEKLATLGMLAGSVGHELRNPLGVINTSIYYLDLVQPQADKKIKQHHDMIQQEVRNADKIISDLLDFGRNINADRELVFVPEIVQRTLDRFPVTASVKLMLDFPADLPKVFADPHQVEQILGNLTINACQVMTSEDSSTEVFTGGVLTISARKEKEMVEISVKDTGPGIPPENMKKLFEPLFSTKTKGIGLGLAVSRKLAEANGGWMDVVSSPGKGSTFYLYLPVGEQ